MNTQTAGVWVKASERLPDLSGKYYVRMNRQQIPANNESKQVATFTNHKEWYLENHLHSRDFFYVTPFEWLDESQPTLTIQQALEVWDDAFDSGYGTSICDREERKSDYPDKRTYFLEKFGIDIKNIIK